MSKSLVNGKGDGLDEPVAFKTVLGLENVENTADADKPVSTAQQAALDTKSNAPVTLDLGVLLAQRDLDDADIYKVIIGAAGQDMDLPAHVYGKVVVVDVYADTSQTGGFVFAPSFAGPFISEDIIWEGGVEPTAPTNDQWKRYTFFCNGNRWLGSASGIYDLS
tara:strand:+ start:202 stop:693 length:492 start_codon:yes stop_codon:yes gene_type:complete